MNRARIIGCAVILSFAVYGSARAEDAYTAKNTNLRAGPGRDYPLVAQIPAGSAVEVAGCLNDYAWCDVVAGPDRGWAYSGNLEYPYEGHRVAIIQEGPVIGIPIVTYSVGPYWDTYYRGRPWYGRRSYFYARPFPQPHAWVRPSGPGFRPGGPRVVGGQPGSGRPGYVRPNGHVDSGRRTVQPRAVQPRAVQPRAMQQAAPHHEVRQPATRQASPHQQARPSKQQDRKHGPGSD